MAKSDYDRQDFITCFRRSLQALFGAITFTIFDCGFRPRCALEVDGSEQVRMHKILSIIAECKFGLHDMTSRERRLIETKLPRFNMSLELSPSEPRAMAAFNSDGRRA